MCLFCACAVARSRFGVWLLGFLVVVMASAYDSYDSDDSNDSHDSDGGSSAAAPGGSSAAAPGSSSAAAPGGSSEEAPGGGGEALAAAPGGFSEAASASRPSQRIVPTPCPPSLPLSVLSFSGRRAMPAAAEPVRGMFGLYTAPVDLPWMMQSSAEHDAATEELERGTEHQPPISRVLLGRGRAYNNGAYNPHQEDTGDEGCHRDEGWDGAGTDSEDDSGADEVAWEARSDDGRDLEGWIEFNPEGVADMRELDAAHILCRDPEDDWYCDVAGPGCLRPEDVDYDEAHQCHEDGEKTICDVCFDTYNIADNWRLQYGENRCLRSTTRSAAASARAFGKRKLEPTAAPGTLPRLHNGGDKKKQHNNTGNRRITPVPVVPPAVLSSKALGKRKLEPTAVQSTSIPSNLCRICNERPMDKNKSRDRRCARCYVYQTHHGFERGEEPLKKNQFC